MSLQVGMFYKSCVNVRDYIHTHGGRGGDSPGAWVYPMYEQHTDKRPVQLT